MEINLDKNYMSGSAGGTTHIISTQMVTTYNGENRVRYVFFTHIIIFVLFMIEPHSNGD